MKKYISRTPPAVGPTSAVPHPRPVLERRQGPWLARSPTCFWSLAPWCLGMSRQTPSGQRCGLWTVWHTGPADPGPCPGSTACYTLRIVERGKRRQLSRDLASPHRPALTHSGLNLRTPWVSMCLRLAASPSSALSSF
jgi:hypothetical protein